MKISLCIPLYNEEKILPETVRTVSEYMSETFGDDYEIIYINDGSTDQSQAILNRESNPRVRVISYRENRGKGYAVRRGMTSASGDIVLFTDCDLAYGLDVVREFLIYFEEHPDTDLLIGSRALHPEGYAGYSFLRRCISKLYMRVLSVFGGFRLSDSQSGIKGFRREMARRVFSVSEVDRFAFDFEAILLTKHFGGKIDEYPVKIIHNRPSSIHFFKDSIRMMRDVLKMKKKIKKIKKETSV